jgi:hypothetical protein
MTRIVADIGFIMRFAPRTPFELHFLGTGFGDIIGRRLSS